MAGVAVAGRPDKGVGGILQKRAHRQNAALGGVLGKLIELDVPAAPGEDVDRAAVGGAAAEVGGSEEVVLVVSDERAFGNGSVAVSVGKAVEYGEAGALRIVLKEGAVAVPSAVGSRAVEGAVSAEGQALVEVGSVGVRIGREDARGSGGRK